MGLYNDVDNHWILEHIRNGETRLYYDSGEKMNTFSSGIEVNGQIRATNQVIAYYSDERLKDFDGKIDSALDKVMQLNGYYYTGNDRAKELGFEGDHKQVGVSAQEVMKVMPEVVQDAPINSKSEEKDLDYKTVQYERLVPLLIEAIKELKQEINTLKGDN
jgi:hypothetical protein